MAYEYCPKCVENHDIDPAVECPWARIEELEAQVKRLTIALLKVFDVPTNEQLIP